MESVKALAVKFGKLAVVAVLGVLAYLGGASTSDTVKIVSDKDAAVTYCQQVLNGHVSPETTPTAAK